MIWINTFFDFDKYILWFGQIHLMIWTNTFYDLDKYILESGQIQYTANTLHCTDAIYFQTNKLCNLNKSISWFGKYILKSGQIPCDAAKAVSWLWDQCWHLFPLCTLSDAVQAPIKVDGEICQNPNFQQCIAYIWLAFLECIFSFCDFGYNILSVS